MRISKEHVIAIVINLISDLLWFGGSSFLGVIPILLSKTINIWTIIFLCVVLILFLFLHIKYYKDLYYIKWDFYIKKNIYTLSLNEDSNGNRTGIFTQSYDAYINSKGKKELTGSYDWSDVNKITKAQVSSRLSDWKLLHKTKNAISYTSIRNDNGTKDLPTNEKCVDYIIKYDNISYSKNEKFENTVTVNFEYDRTNLEKEFYAAIKHPVGELEIILFASDDIVKDVSFYAKTFLGEEYNIIEKDLIKKKTDESGNTYYKMKIKKPKLFCKYIICWEWV